MSAPSVPPPARWPAVKPRGPVQEYVDLDPFDVANEIVDLSLVPSDAPFAETALSRRTSTPANYKPSQPAGRPLRAPLGRPDGYGCGNAWVLDPEGHGSNHLGITIFLARSCTSRMTRVAARSTARPPADAFAKDR